PTKRKLSGAQCLISTSVGSFIFLLNPRCRTDSASDPQSGQCSLRIIGSTIVLSPENIFMLLGKVSGGKPRTRGLREAKRSEAAGLRDPRSSRVPSTRRRPAD